MASKSKKSRKVDRQRKSAQNTAYISQKRHVKSHQKRIKAHLQRFPTDQAATAALAKYTT